MEPIINFFLSLQDIDPGYAVMAFFSIFFWGYYLFLFHPEQTNKKLVIILIALFLGFVSTKVILALHPVLWPEVNFKPKKMHIITQTAYIAFIQAGMMEETFKILFILLEGFVFAFSWKDKKWNRNIVLVGGFVALGFSLIENYIYIHKENQSTYAMINTFIGRTVFSSNIHLLINLCFSLFLIKSNDRNGFSKFSLIFMAFLLAVVQHGVVDFFLLPSSRFGNWLAAALFLGIWVWVARDLRTYAFKEEVLVEDSITEKDLVDVFPSYSPPVLTPSTEFGTDQFKPISEEQ